MDKKLKAKWIKALRSGRYRQAKETLRETALGSEGYCCLGVLCTVSRKGRWTGRFGAVYSIEAEPYDINLESELGKSGRQMFGIPDRVETRLINMNDNGKTFDQIAAYIEKRL